MVTYNRSHMLEQGLRALREQTRLPDALVVIDNASTDDTQQVIKEFEVDHPFTRLEVVLMEDNTGGAGGFSAGMRTALELGTDWVWVMDDDVAPEPTCLERLLHHTDISECIHPLRITADGQEQAWEPVQSIATGTTTYLDNVSFANGKDVAYTNVACFEGALISARIVRLVGPPDPAYFIIGDDTVFGLKASAHTNIVIVREAHLHRLLPMTSFAPWKVYYFTRNAFLVRTDACNYLGIRTSRVQNLVFGLNLALETSRHVRRGRKFVMPALRGFRDGRAYAREHSSRRRTEEDTAPVHAARADLRPGPPAA